MAACGPDCISLDQSVDLAEGIDRIGTGFAVQVRTCLFGEHLSSLGGFLGLSGMPCNGDALKIGLDGSYNLVDIWNYAGHRGRGTELEALTWKLKTIHFIVGCG